MKKFVITIDGPSGVGKTTIGKTISERLNLNFFSSGSIYRSVAKYLIENDVAEVDDLDIEILSNRCTVNGISYDEKDLYDQKISIKSSEIAKLQDLRDNIKSSLNQYFNNLDNSLVIEGRDMGSVVFTDAKYKVYLDADLATRGKRREGQSNMVETITDVQKRDFEDKNRLISPLTIPDGALVVDNSTFTINETIDYIIESLKLR
tara:strand:+ start:831 stop:1445 length:615 start_codon:yes stop_codon:yes gene_type:complete